MYKSYVSPVYGQRWEEFMHSPRANTPEKYRVDHIKLEIHLERLGGGTVFRVGFTKAIFNKQFYKLDPNDYSRSAKEENGEVLVPAPYLCKFFDEELCADANGYVNLHAVCREKNIPLFYDEETGLAVVAMPPAHPFSREEDERFLERIALSFEEPHMPEPKYNNSEQTRILIEESEFPKGDYDWFTKQYVNLYSPSLLITRDREGRKVYYVSYEHAEGTGWDELQTETVLRRSYDEGKTWEDVAVFDNIRWAILFEVKGRIYLCGTLLHPDAALRIARLEDDGSLTEADLHGPEGIWTNPNAHLIYKGRLHLPTFPYAMAADVDADFLKPESWTYSNSFKDMLTKDWFFAETGAEGLETFWPLENNVVEKDGKLYQIMRLECIPNNGYAGLLEMTDDGKNVKLAPECNGMVEMPTTVTKFMVRYDEATGLYLAFANLPTIPMPFPSRSSTPVSGHRNILGLVASPDLVNWKVLDVMLCDRAVLNCVASARSHGFQYVIWEFDGEDLVYVVRESVGYTKTYHDGQCVTLYRLKDYKNFVKERYENSKIWKNPNRNRENHN